MFYTKNNLTVTVGNCTVTPLTRDDHLYTFELVYPRIIHSEFMTHRMMCRNAASSRATPIQTMIKEVLEHPYIPREWPKNKAGMWADENITDPERVNDCIKDWLSGRDSAVSTAKILNIDHIHKEIVNRVLEPYQYIRVIATSTDWDNFVRLRATHYAQPDIRDLAYAISNIIGNDIPQSKFPSACVPIMLNGTQCHVYYPYVTTEEAFESDLSYDTLALISAARCARVSYLKHDGTSTNYIDDINLGKRLIKDGHMTPFEHIILSEPIRMGGLFFGPLFEYMNYRYLIEGKYTIEKLMKNPDEFLCGY